MTSNRAQRIANTLDQRAPLVRRLDLVSEALARLKIELTALEVVRNHMLETVTDPLARANLNRLDFVTPVASLSEEMTVLAKLKGRFSRDTLNLGVIGRARQGKSKLLQSLSGLTDNEIPSGSRSHCTGVRSSIYHSSQTEPHAEITFYSRITFLNQVVGPYYRELPLGPMPATWQDFVGRPLQDLPKDALNSTVAKAKYRHLQELHEHSDKYESLLDKPTKSIAIEEVRQYVAQDTVDGNRTFFNYLAVQQARIYCRYPDSTVGRVALIDMPGLGDTGAGDVERLVKVLGQDVDAVIFVRLPSSTGAHWQDVDLDLYEVARTALVDLPIELWSFLVINRTSAGPESVDNAKNCEDLMRDLSKESLVFTSVHIANCMNTEDARGNVLDPILTYLEENVQRLDQQYISASQGRIDGIVVNLQQTLHSASQALGRGSVAEGEFRRFDELFKGAWRDLTTGLENLVGELRTWSTEPNQRLSLEVDQCIEACRSDTGIPSLEEIESAAKLHGSFGTAFNQYLHKVRTHLVGHFMTLEDTLRLSLDDVRGQVATVLADDAQLKALAEGEGTEYLRGLTVLIPNELCALRSAFETLASVELTYRGFLQYRMRRHLMHLHPDGPLGDGQVRVNPNAESVREALVILHERVVFRLEDAFEEWLAEPNLVASAIVEEFVDRVLRSEEAYDEWRSFYLENRADIWVSEFDEIGERSRLRQAWDGQVSNVGALNRLADFQLAPVSAAAPLPVGV